MKYHPLLFPILAFCSMAVSAADNMTLLSNEKQTILQKQQEIYDSEHEKLRTNWIAPINLNATYEYDKSALGDTHSDMKRASASVSQDIFRSGGITYQIQYADAKMQTNSITLQMQIASLNQQLFTALLSVQKSLLQLEQSRLRLDNHEIALFIKRHLYDAGKADITELNNVLMLKSSELKTYASAKYAIAQQRFEVTKISDIDPNTFSIPSFELIQKEDFLQNQFEVQYARAQSDTLQKLYDVTRTNYLPSLAVNGNIGYQSYDPKELSGSYSGNYYGAGVSLNLPLVYNASSTIQEAKASYLQEVATSADKRRELESTYTQTIEKIESYREYIAITTHNLALYDDLIQATQAGVDSGTKTGYDLQTLKNSKKIEELEIKINEINIQTELAKLHFSLKTSKELL
ncbi:MAG: TolC family protein [Pseudomonadota bacterium]